MTFSDAEEDQPSVIQSGNMSNGISASNVREPSSNEDSTNEVSQLGGDNQAAGSSNNIQSTENDDNETESRKESPTACNPASTSSCSTLDSSNNSNENSGSHENESVTIQANNIAENNVNEISSQASLPLNSDDAVPVVGAESNVKGLGTEKVLEKLQQIHGYIQQTAAAMQTLEREGDLNKIGQYNTLVKCMRDLKKSEMKLTSHLNKINEKTSQNNLNNSQISSENVDNSNHSQRQPGTSGSESIGVVGDINESANPPSMRERLAVHESEQQQLSERLRDSLARREDLMVRYQATRERLNNLKRQRLGLVHEERRLLQSVGAPASPYDDPVIGTDGWSIEQLENGIRDFQGLQDKVARLSEAYSTKLQSVDGNDIEARNELQRKIDQLLHKRAQIANALAQITNVLQAKREGVEVGEAASNFHETSGSSSNIDPAETQLRSENSRIPSENDIGSSNEEAIELEGAAVITSEAEDLHSKQQHLQSLKDQLMNMKKLLQVTQDALPFKNEEVSRNEFDSRRSESVVRSENIYVSEDGEQLNGNEDDDEQPLIESTIVGVNGEVIHLSEMERRNPHVVSKYRQLSEAKQRLAKMEEIMNKIAEARQSGKPLTEVLSPENMAILNEARREEEEENAAQEASSANAIEGIDDFNPTEVITDRLRTSNESLAFSQRSHRDLDANSNPRMNSINKKQDNPSNGRNKWEREREISAMQYHFKKKTPGIPSVNEGYKVDREKGAIKKQARELLTERGNDPRLLEVAALQEELKEKKNALEALMRRMGKSSSFTIDNISDNISENVSDLNSETLEKPSASWGASHSQGRYISDHQSDEDLLDTNEEEISFNFGASQDHYNARQRVETSIPLSSSNTKNRNKYPQKPQRQQEHNRFSVNNLRDSLPKSVRPKQNRASAGSIPVTSWENVANTNATSSHNSSNKVQNTVAAALTQLTQVQETINSLYGDLRAAEMSARQQEIPNLGIYGSNALLPQFPFSVVPQSYLPNYCVSPLPSTQGRGDLGASNHILAGLQQCFSQLYLHSLEIQSLSKHLQIIDQREKSATPPHIKEEERSGSIERSDRHSLSRRINENSHQNFPQRYNPSFHNVPNPRYENRKGKCQERGTDIQNAETNQNFSRNGVSNPIYASLINTQQPSSSWQMETRDGVEQIPYGNKNLFPPFETEAADDLQPANEDLIIDSSSHFPIDVEEINEELPWTALSNPQIQQQSSDILNNQVLPGTRANNYWDNFRSYSRQNPLSSTTKCNTAEQFPPSGSSTPGRRQSLNTGSRLQPSVTYENKTRHSSNNSINKASDKNSSTSRIQNKGGTRSRCFAQQTEGGRQLTANSSFQTSSSNAVNHRFDNVSYKRNNRHEYVNDYEQETYNHLESNQNHGRINNEERLVHANISNNSRRHSREREESAPRNCEANGTGRNVSSRRVNTIQPENVNTSETFSQVVREAESLMEKHSQQPQFLLQLFHHAAKITSNTDQQVALELLRELSYQRHQNNIQCNRWTSNSSVTHSDNFSLTTHRETDNRNIRVSNKNTRAVRGVSGSDASESGLTSDEEDTKVLYHMVKNLTPTSSSVGNYPPLRSSPQALSDPSNNPSSVGVSPIHASNAVQNQHQQAELRKEFSKDIVNIVTPAANKERSKSVDQHYGNRFQRKRHEVEFPSRNYIPSGTSCDSPSASSNPLASSSVKLNPKLSGSFEQSYYPIGDKHNNRRQTKKSPRRNLSKAAEEKSNFSSKNDKKNLSTNLAAVAANDVSQETVSGYEALVSSSLRVILLCFENADYSLASTPQILDNLHHSIMRQVQFHSSTLGFSSNFASSIDSQLKVTLHGFYGASFPAIREELAAAVTQVLIQEYFALFMQQENASEAAESQMQESNISNDACSLKRTEPESNNKRTVAPQFHKQISSNSLFSCQDNTVKQNRASNVSWPFRPLVPAEDGPSNKGSLLNNNNVNTNSKEDELKCDASNAKSKGAISKNSVSQNGPVSNYRDEAFAVNQESSNIKRESPFLEASSFPESWVIQRGNMNQSDVEGVYSFPESSFSRERDERNFVGANENLSFERNDAEADQENADFLNISLPVHDLAEADQSQEADCVDSSIENDQYEAASASSSHQEPKEYPLRFIPKKKITPEQGLDEVPTRLLNPTDVTSPPLSVSGRHFSEDSNEARYSHRCGHYPSQTSPPHSQASNHAINDQNIPNHGSESSSGIGG